MSLAMAKNCVNCAGVNLSSRSAFTSTTVKRMTSLIPWKFCGRRRPRASRA